MTKHLLNLSERIGLRSLVSSHDAKPDAASFFSVALEALLNNIDLQDVYYLDLSLNHLEDADVPLLSTFVEKFPNLRILNLNQNFFHSESKCKEVRLTTYSVFSVSVSVFFCFSLCWSFS